MYVCGTSRTLMMILCSSIIWYVLFLKASCTWYYPCFKGHFSLHTWLCYVQVCIRYVLKETWCICAFHDTCFENIHLAFTCICFMNYWLCIIMNMYELWYMLTGYDMFPWYVLTCYAMLCYASYMTNYVLCYDSPCYVMLCYVSHAMWYYVLYVLWVGKELIKPLDL